jgi:hypothetical protein
MCLGVSAELGDWRNSPSLQSAAYHILLPLSMGAASTNENYLGSLRGNPKSLAIGQ